MIGLILLLYLLFITWLIFSKPKSVEKGSEKLTVSIVIAYRNEEHNLDRLLSNLKQQEFPLENLELILVNDHSSDDSFNLANTLSVDFPFSFTNISLKENKGKKAAISKAIESAKNDIVLCTDADCWMSPNWVSEMTDTFESDKTQMTLGPVKLNAENGTWFQQIQAFEFSSLMAVTSFTANRNRAIISNGANYAFRRKAFLESDKFEGNEKVATGDDVFLLHAFKDKFGKEAILFVNEVGALVETTSNKDVIPFMNQRIRWASKSKNYKDYDTLKFGILITAVNLVVLAVFIGFLIRFNSFTFFFGVFCFKWILDLMLIQKLPHWLRTNSIVKWSFLLSIVYPFYSVGIALVSLFYRPDWKGRKI